MPSISIFEIIAYVRKHIRIVLICALICGVFGQFIVKTKQSYTASMVIKYTYTLAAEGKNPKGEKLDVYEITSPVVIEKVINELGLNTSVEKIRNSISITPFIDSTTKQKQKALTEKGEDFEYFPVQYTIKFSYSGGNGQAYGRMLLNKLLTSYDEYFRQTYTGQRKIQDAFTNLNYDNYDYMEICELYEGQFEAIDKLLTELNTEDPSFRSSKTGLSFSDLSSSFNNLYMTDYDKLYSSVRIGLLSKNKELLIKKYQHKIEDLSLTKTKKSEAAQVSYNVLVDFYKQYKEGLVNNELGFTPDNQNDTGGQNIIKEKDASKIITTYDQIMTQYVEVGVEASDAKNYINYYTDLMNAYAGDQVPADAKKSYTTKADKLILKIDDQMKTYISLSNETLNDYNRYKGTQYVSFLTTAESKALLSKNVVLAFALAVGLFLGLFIAIGIEWIKKLKQNANTELRIERIESLKEGIIPVDTSALTQMEKLLYDQAAGGFQNFRLYYQPIVNVTGQCVGAEALVRWHESGLGILMPDEFLPLAEQHDMMALLGEWILKSACEQCKKWNRIYPDMWISINFTTNQINSLKFMDGIYAALENSGVNTSNIVLEVSNGGEIEDTQSIAKKLVAIKTFGVRVSIDNFGNKNSSVEALYSLPIDIVKIDKNITAGIATNLNDMNLVSNIVNTANLLHYKVCAEGVETAEQHGKMSAIGVDYMQGFYFAKPMPSEKLDDLMSTV